MINELKQGLNFYITHLSCTDFAGYIWMFLTFLAVLALCIYIASKSYFAGFALTVVSIAALGYGAHFMPKFLDQNLRARELEIVSTKQLEYSNTLLVDIRLKNLSKKPFNYCEIGLVFYKNSDNILRRYANELKPFLKENIVLKDVLDVNATREITHVVNDFRVNDYNVTASSECF